LLELGPERSAESWASVQRAGGCSLALCARRFALTPPYFTIELKDAAGEVHAIVEKTVNVRKRGPTNSTG